MNKSHVPTGLVIIDPRISTNVLDLSRRNVVFKVKDVEE